MLVDPLDRRRFLTGLAKGAAIAAWAGVGGLGGACAGPLAASAAREGELEVLRRPLVLRRGEVLADRRFALAPDFAWTSVMAAIYVEDGAKGVTIRNVHLQGADSWQSRWDRHDGPSNAARGIHSGTCGIRMQGAPRAVVENVTIRGFPGAAIDGFGFDDAVIRDVTVERCFFGVVVRHYKPSHRLRVERVHARDLWGPGPGRWPGIGGMPSRQHPGRFTGSDGLVLHSLRHSVVSDCSALGDQFGSFKLVNPQHTEVSGLRGVHLMIQGTSDLEWKIDKEPSRDTTVRNCTLDSRLGHGPLSKAGSMIQASWHVRGLRIENCTLTAAGKDGDAIQFAVDVHGHVSGCTIDGFNGRTGDSPACAMDLVDGSTVNDDFAQVNTFVNQKRMYRSR